MIKKMRYRMILAAMLAFTSVVLLIVLLVNVTNYLAVTRRVDESLSYLLDFEKGTANRPDRNGPPMGPFMGMRDEESNYMMRFFVVRFDEEGNIRSTDMDYVATVDGTGAREYGQQAYNSRAAKGYISNYRYVKEVIEDSTVIIFLNAGRERRDMWSLLYLTLAISLVSLLAVLVLVVLFSRRAIRPFADNINRQKQFITDAGHELKTPLTSISTSLDVLTMQYGEDEWTDNIRKQTGRMSKLVSELVALSRLDEENPLPGKEQFSLSSAAWEIVDIYTQQAKACDKHMDVDIEDQVTIYGEKAAIQQMLSVLLDNAIRYSNEGGNIRVAVSGKKNKARIEVVNTCDYETPPDTDKLFDRFYRPDGSRSTATGGTGVGLAIAKAVVEAHGGSITASCPDGKEMTIKVKL